MTNKKKTHEGHKAELIDRFSQKIGSTDHNNDELVALFTASLDSYDENCEYCCYRYNKNSEEHDAQMERLERKETELSSEIETLSTFGCGSLFIAAVCLFIMVMVIATKDPRGS